VNEEQGHSEILGSSTHEGPGISHFLLIFRRRWRLFAITWVSVVALISTYTFISTRLYRPQATLEIRPESALLSSENDPTLLATRSLFESYYSTQETILTSPFLHEETLKALPEAIRKQYEGNIDPVQTFSKQVDVEKNRSSFIIKVGFIDADPQKATQVVNTLVSLYLEEANRRLKEMKTGAAELLSKEALPSIKQGVDDADKAVQQYLAQNAFMDPNEVYAGMVESRRTVIGRITGVRLRQIGIRAQMDTLRGYLVDGVTGVFNPAFYGTKNLEILISEQEITEGALSRELKELKEDHPTILELRDQLKRIEIKIKGALKGTLDSLSTDLIAAEQEEKAAIEEQAKIEKEMADVIQKVSVYKRLDSEYTAARDLYNAYLKKQGETQATSGTGLGSVRVVDHAQPPLVPYRPNIPINLAVGGLLGIMLGMGLMFLSEQLDDRILSPKEIEAFVGVSVLGIVPKLTVPPGGDGKPVILSDQSSIAEFEAFRCLRAEITTRLEAVQGCRTVAILSPMSSEGKSTVAANTAKVLAMDGRRVLLFDADMRRPTVKRNIGFSEFAGLEQVLKDEVTLQQAIHRGKIDGVDVLGMSLGTTHAAELAGSAKFEEILKRVREMYDYVIVDSAPVIQASESPLIARRCNAVVLVVRERQTGRGAAHLAVRRMEGMGITLLGAVLNGADPKGRGYGYGYYGYYSYYGSKDDSK
jgi:polysaccharide biosynthesis transport protein